MSDLTDSSDNSSVSDGASEPRTPPTPATEWIDLPALNAAIARAQVGAAARSTTRRPPTQSGFRNGSSDVGSRMRTGLTPTLTTVSLGVSVLCFLPLAPCLLEHEPIVLCVPCVSRIVCPLSCPRGLQFRWNVPPPNTKSRAVWMCGEAWEACRLCFSPSPLGSGVRCCARCGATYCSYSPHSHTDADISNPHRPTSETPHASLMSTGVPGWREHCYHEAVDMRLCMLGPHVAVAPHHPLHHRHTQSTTITKDNMC